MNELVTGGTAWHCQPHAPTKGRVAVLVILTLVYDVGLARWLQNNLPDPVDLEIFLIGVLRPLPAFLVLTSIGCWCTFPAAL